MEITRSEWLQAMKLPEAHIPDVVIVEGSWWRQQRTDWRLSYLTDVRELEFLQENEDPYLLIGTPPCNVFSQLWHIGKYNRDPAWNEEQRRLGEKHLATCIAAYRRQMQRGRYFLHEHPLPAGS